MSTRRKILVLEDQPERIADLEKSAFELGADYELKLWRDGYSMRNDCELFFPEAALISLNDCFVLKFLAECRPVCPVILHSGGSSESISIEHELSLRDWIIERVPADPSDSIQAAWLAKARELLGKHKNTWPASLPEDHKARMQRALLSLDGLSVGDAFGECFFGNSRVAERRIEQRDPPPGPWFYTDDTTMALSIVRCLKRYGHIEREALAASFAREYARDPRRGYGGTAHGILRAIGAGTAWQEAAGCVFNGEGSCGNGGAMRSAPIGAYFADDFDKVITEARSSAEVSSMYGSKAWEDAKRLVRVWLTYLPIRECVLITFNTEIKRSPVEGFLRLRDSEGQLIAANQAALLEEVSHASLGTYTDTYRALAEAYKSQGVDLVLLFTDGKPQTQGAGFNEMAPRIYRLVQEHRNIPILAVGLGDYEKLEGDDKRAGVDLQIEFLKKIAKFSNGTFMAR